MLKEKELKKVSVIGMGLLGASVTMSAMRTFPGVAVVGFSHRPSTRQKARELNVASCIADSLEEAVSQADIVIAATPIMTFESLFKEIKPWLKKGCIVTDVGSTKAIVHKWADKLLPDTVFYVGSHPIAGSEKRGVEYARDDLLTSARCILTQTAKTNKKALNLMDSFWSALGCNVEMMDPKRHDLVYGLVSHLPHVVAAALVNAGNSEMMKYAGKGFIDTTRIASGPADVWMDIVLTNNKNIVKGLDGLLGELTEMKKAIAAGDAETITRLLEKAKASRDALIEYKLSNKELI